MQKLKIVIAKYKTIIIAVIVVTALIVGVPFIINELYKKDSGYITEWGAEDVLVYYGAILAALGTVAGVFLTVKHSQAQYRKDEMNRVLPYIALTKLHGKAHVNLLSFAANREPPSSADDLSNDYAYEEFKLNHVYIIIENGTIQYKDDLTTSQKEILSKSGFKWEKTQNGYQLKANRYLSLPFIADNVGNGAMVNLRISFNKGENNKRAVTLFTLRPGENTYFHIFCDNLTDECCGEYSLDFQYRDIRGTTYIQSFPFYIEKESNSFQYNASIDMTGTQTVEITSP